MIDLLFTKFLDVKSPLGIRENENEQNCEYHSIGIDIYMPKPTIEFVNQILEKNPFKLIEYHTRENNQIQEFIIKSKADELIISYINEKYHINMDLNIPTGIGILIPKGYYIDLRSKSGNFSNDFTSVTGLIDENFTYGMSVQFHKLNKKTIEISPDQKLSQFVLRKSNFVNSMVELTIDKWNDLEEVQKRRINRKGGLGHTGKF